MGETARAEASPVGRRGLGGRPGRNRCFRSVGGGSGAPTTLPRGRKTRWLPGGGRRLPGACPMGRQPAARACAIDTGPSTTVRGYQASEHRMAVLLARMDDGKLHEEFGYAKLTDYAAERLGLEPR